MNFIRNINLKLLILSSVIALLSSGCGFSPMYAHKDGQQATHEVLSSIAIANIPDREGQMLRNLLIDRFYRHGVGEQKYRLVIALDSTIRKTGIQKDDTATRAQMIVNADYELWDDIAGKVIYKATDEAQANYSILVSQYATTASENDAFERALEQIAASIEARLSLYLTRK